MGAIMACFANVRRQFSEAVGLYTPFTPEKTSWPIRQGTSGKVAVVSIRHGSCDRTSWRRKSNLFVTYLI